MTAYRYRAAAPDGRVVRGELALATEEEVSAELSRRGLFTLHVAPTNTISARRAGRGDVSALLQSLATMSEAGIPLHRALEASAGLIGEPLRGIALSVRDQIREGESLGTAMASHGGVFSAVTIGLIKAGERGAGLDVALREAASQSEREAATREAIRSALAYPLLLAVVGGTSVILILVFLLPRFAALLEDLGSSPPPLARALLVLSSALRGHLLSLSAGLIAAVVLIAILAAPNGKRRHERLVTIPVIGPIVHGFATARVCRVLSGLFGCGMSALPALEVAGEAAGNQAISERLAGARMQVAQGATLMAALERHRVLAGGATTLIGIGEASGRLSILLAKAADLEEARAQRQLKRLTAFLEPALILGFAAVVAIVAGGLLQAIYSIRPGSP